MNDDKLLADGGRLEALSRTGLSAAADPMFDRFAEMVRRVLGVPVALVSLVEPGRQFFPGACGLADPWQQERQTPLSHSFCQHVVISEEPLIVTDARTDPRVVGNLAISDLGVVGYAGMPLTDADGLVLGSLCAIDTEPRDWTARELDLLADLAAACSDSLRLRIATAEAENAERHAWAEYARSGTAFQRSQLLLRASAALAATATLEDVVAAVRDLVVGVLDPAYVGVTLFAAGGQLALTTGEALPAGVAGRWARIDATDLTPSALAAHTGNLVLLGDPAEIVTRTPDAAATFELLGWQSSAAAPLPGPRGPIGALVFTWKQPNVLEPADQAVLAALAGYVAQALQRALLLDDRRTAASTLQKALLSPLPAGTGLSMAARYVPAQHEDHVGGDWYDAIPVDAGRLALVIGDVTGHNIDAAAAMSQFRSVLRGLIIDRHEPPSALLRRLEQTTRALGSTHLATVLLAYLEPDPAGGHLLTWSNAGHPAPTLSLPDGGISQLEGRDPLLGALRHVSRRNYTRHVPPGSLLLLHTDGLVETRVGILDEGVASLHRALAGAGAVGLEELADVLLAHAGAGEPEDDAALLLVRTPMESPGRD